LTALAEAGIDFADQDLEEVALPRLKRQLEPLVETIRRLVESHARGFRIQDGVGVAFVGLPNAGKSSFFNALLGEDRSIVSSVPGTTRDVIRERLTLKEAGRAVTLRLEDTAGLRASSDEVERAGVARSLEAARRADLVLFIVDSAVSFEPVRKEWEALLSAVPGIAEKTLGILAKSDLRSDSARIAPPFSLPEWVTTSALTGLGISEAVHSIITACDRWTRRQPGEILLTRQGQLESARLGLTHLLRAADAPEVDLFAADLKQALGALGPLIGDTLPEDLLGRIFSDFCIGK
jgi:tRNA modification GTPase